MSPRAADHVHQGPHSFLPPGDAGDVRVLPEVDLNPPKHVLAIVLIVVARRPRALAMDINFYDAVHVLQLPGHVAVGKEEIPGHDIHVSVFGLGQDFLEKISALVVRRAELVQRGVPKVFWIVVKHRAAMELVRLLRAVIGKGVARELPPTGAVVPRVGV